MEKGNRLENLVPAAQYIRMSREVQRFSPENQKAAIAAYAFKHGFDIVATYQDDGRSGLTITGRPELRRLLRDVLEDDKPFRAVLVLDVSRWGRFQDADQAAHYEYMCREAGAPVFYCSEAFDNAGGAMATLIKQMKRVMAAEYSRELSVKVARAQRHQARLGYKQGGPAVFGTRRQLVDEHGKRRMILPSGQWKGVATDRVIHVHGPAKEVATVRLAFDLYVDADLSLSEVAAELNRRGKRRRDGSRWEYSTVRDLLTKEILTGTYVFGRRQNNLGKRRPAPAEDHVRVAVMAPIVSRETFDAACAKRERTRRLYLTNEVLIARLRQLSAETDYVTEQVVRDCPYLPGPEVFRRRFGSLRAACQMVGISKPYIAKSAGWKRVLSNEDILAGLKHLYEQHGYLSQALIEADPHSPGVAFIRKRLGSLLEAYRRLGIAPKAFSNRIYQDSTGADLRPEWLLSRLSDLLTRRGFLTGAIIDEDESCPSAWYYRKAFGSLPAAYAQLGYCATQSEIMKAAGGRRRLRGEDRSAKTV